MSKNTQLDMLREAADRPPYKQTVYVNAGQLLAEIEREYLPRPRFEDGEPVKLGDTYITDSGKVGTVYRIEYLEHQINIWPIEGNSTGIAELVGDERVKRPEPEVLDSDGVPIKVGDTVWHEEDGTELAVRGFCGEEDGETMVEVERISGKTDWSCCRCLSLTHKQPDSLERIEEDAKLDVCVYFGHDQTSCEGCPVRRNPDECEAQKALDLLSRQRKVLERGHER